MFNLKILVDCSFKVDTMATSTTQTEIQNVTSNLVFKFYSNVRRHTTAR
jgi:hypothetical protein